MGELCAIVPFHEPRWLENTLENLRRVGAPPCVLVLNGPALGMPCSLPCITSAQSHADAVNAGANWARTQGYTHAVCLDSDDWYGAEYLAQARAALAAHDYCGKRSVRVRLADGIHLFERPGGLFLGGTLGFSLAHFVPMRATLQDDTEWCRDMIGARGADTGPDQYVYNRHGENAHWQAPDVHVRRAWGASLRDDGTRFAAPTDAEVLDAM